MFQNQRFLTRGVEVEIPMETQLFIWALIDERIQQGAKLDYLQVFNLTYKKDKVGNYIQEIEHIQEVPPYKKKYQTTNAEGKYLNTKVFVIDSDTYSTMLLAEEY